MIKYPETPEDMRRMVQEIGGYPVLNLRLVPTSEGNPDENKEVLALWQPAEGEAPDFDRAIFRQGRWWAEDTYGCKSLCRTPPHYWCEIPALPAPQPLQ